MLGTPGSAFDTILGGEFVSRSPTRIRSATLELSSDASAALDQETRTNAENWKKPMTRGRCTEVRTRCTRSQLGLRRASSRRGSWGGSTPSGSASWGVSRSWSRVRCRKKALRGAGAGACWWPLNVHRGLQDWWIYRGKIMDFASGTVPVSDWCPWKLSEVSRRAFASSRLHQILGRLRLPAHRSMFHLCPHSGHPPVPLM